MKPTLLFLLAVHAAVASPPTGVVPFVDCVSFDQSTNLLTAFFGYVSVNTGNVTVNVGPDNYFSPAPANQGQPTVFSAGGNPDTFLVTFNVTEISQLTWNLLGQTVTASNDPTMYCSSCICPEGPAGPQGPQGPPGANAGALAPVQVVTSVSANSSAAASCSAQQTLLGGGGSCLVSGQNGRMSSSSAFGSTWAVVCSIGQATAVALCAGPNSP